MIKLYKKDSTGRIRTWRGWVEGDEVVTRTGLEGGKKKEERRRAKPKNEGKANETTGPEQAELELISKANRERDKGYFDTLKEVSSNVVVLPMLAHPFDKRKKDIVYPAIVQPKLDGVRAMVELGPDTIGMLSRKGKLFPYMPKLMGTLVTLGDILEEEFEGITVFLDGELFSDEIPFEELSGHCRRMNHEAKGTTHLLDLIKLNVFDCYLPGAPDTPFEERHKFVQKLLGGVSFESVQLVANTYVANEDEVKQCHSLFVKEGHEGTIIRNINSPYKLNARSKDLLKYKDFLDEEFPIVGATEAEGRDEGTVIWVCITQDGQEFNVRPRGTHAQRTEWFQNRDQYLDRMLTVRYQELTGDGIPRFPVGIAIRDYE